MEGDELSLFPEDPLSRRLIALSRVTSPSLKALSPSFLYPICPSWTRRWNGDSGITIATISHEGRYG